MDVTSSAVATYSTFENIYNSKFSATQVAEFCKRLKKSATCIIMTDESLQDTLTAYDQILRRFLQNDDGPPVRIGFLVDVTRDSTVASLSDDIIRYLLDNEIILDGQVRQPYHLESISKYCIYHNNCLSAKFNFCDDHEIK